VSLRIPATVDYRIGGTWDGLPYLDAPAIITDTFGNYPDWRKNFDHDGDPSTPPKDFGPHKGIDMGNAQQNRLGAADDGVVYWVQFGHEVSGNFVIIAHPGESLGVTEATYYLHMQSIEVTTGQEVKRGDYIGREGSTGAVTGPHLHFAVRVNDQYVNPMDYVVPPGTIPPPQPAPVPSEATLDKQTFEEIYVSHYFLEGASHGGSRMVDDPALIEVRDDGWEDWRIRIRRPKVERP
jgi:murein DD-endopeptidase MepM/ murein hydrolase activator NlpD